MWAATLWSRFVWKFPYLWILFHFVSNCDDFNANIVTFDCSFLLTYKIISCEMSNIRIFYAKKKKKTVNSFISLELHCKCFWLLFEIFFDWDISERKNSRRNEMKWNGHNKKVMMPYCESRISSHKPNYAVCVWPDISFILSNYAGWHFEFLWPKTFAHIVAPKWIWQIKTIAVCVFLSAVPLSVDVFSPHSVTMQSFSHPN